MSASRRLSRNSCGSVEVAHPDLDGPEPLRHVAVRAGAGDQPVLVGEALRLLVEAAHGDSRVEHLEHVDVPHDLQQVLVVGNRVQAVEGMRHVREPALGMDRVDRLLERHAARDLLLDEEADHLSLVRGLDLLGHDHLDPLRALARLERARDLVVVGDRDRAQAALLRRLEQHVHRRRAIR